ncbi:MAG: NAD-dependent epimerase/dehydratase family protein [Methanobrevibacter sp.]|jgi:nucleoside-diphosphate-sugar epimerase|nr:NAD-dependent epimerase/dehydratase family protein [Candidatus Methanoflexus mossambicus]
MEKNILLTGGTGFIGSQLAEDLLNENKKIILFKRSFSDTWRVDNFSSEFIDSDNLVFFDIDKENISEVFETFNIDGILHLATYYSKFHNSNEINDMLYSNITFPTILLENTVKNNVKYFINTGTCFEYSFDKLPVSEKNKIQAVNLYASTKIAFEDVLKFYTREYNLKSSTLKLFTPYGPKDDENKITPYLIINYLKKNKIDIQSASKRLDFTFVLDIIDAYKKTIANVKNFNESEDINVASGVSHTIEEVYSIIDSILNFDEKSEVEFGESDSSEIRSDSTKAKELINWEPNYNLKEGLSLTIDFYKNKYNLY